MTRSLNWLAISLSVGAFAVSIWAAFGAWAQVDAIKETTSESLYLMGITAGVLHADSDVEMGDTAGRIAASIQRDETLSVWMDVSNNGRAAGSITEMSFIVLGERPIPIGSVKCGSREETTARECVLPIPLQQGEQVRIRVDFTVAERKALNCPTRIDNLLFTLTDSTGHDLNIGTEYEEPVWDCG